MRALSCRGGGGGPRDFVMRRDVLSADRRCIAKRDKFVPVEAGHRLMSGARRRSFGAQRLLRARIDPTPVISDILFLGGHRKTFWIGEITGAANGQRRSPDYLRMASRALSAAWPAADCAVPAVFSATPSASSERSPVIFPAASLIEPLTFLASPLMRLLSMTVSLDRGGTLSTSAASGTMWAAGSDQRRYRSTKSSGSLGLVTPQRIGRASGKIG